MNEHLPPPLAPVPAVEIFRSRGRAPCEERAFVLHAVGIASQAIDQGPYWSLVVTPDAAQEAIQQLRRYERENPPLRRFVRPQGTHPNAWAGAAAYACVLLIVAFLAGRKSFATDWLDAGVLDTLAVRSGEAWRAVTALTLHFDVAHLLGNLGFGMFFGWLASQLLGPGVAWGAAAAAGTAANLLNANVQPASHVSAGASTVVFAMLGLLAAYAWRRRAGDGERRAYRWSPLIAGVFLLAFTGAGGERTDVLAHLTGFVMGAVAGALLAQQPRIAGAAAQWVTGLGTLLVVAVAWAIALANGG